MAFVIGVFLLLTIVHCAGDFFMKRASIAFTWLDLIIAISLYVVTIPGWLWMLKMAKLATLASIGSAMQAAILVTIGVVVFHEQLTTREVIGICLAIAAVAMFYK